MLERLACSGVVETRRDLVSWATALLSISTILPRRVKAMYFPHLSCQVALPALLYQRHFTQLAIMSNVSHAIRRGETIKLLARATAGIYFPL